MIPTNISIDLTGVDNRDVQLGWDGNIANTGGYDVHRSTSPYFTPDSSSWFWSLPAGGDSYTNMGAAGTPYENHFYIVLGLSNCDDPSGFEKRVGDNGCGTHYTSDQRGESRPQNGMCDVGAFELEVTAITALMTANH